MFVQFGRLVLVLTLASSCLIFSEGAAAQDPPINVSLRSQWDGFAGSYADIWAEGNFVYIGRFGSAGVEIINITNPDSVFSVGPYLLPAADAGASAQDVKVANGLLFVALEGTNNAGIHIADVRDPTNPVPLVDVDILGFNQIHNVFYDQGFLYFSDSSTPRIGIVDLRTFDPDNPPASNITTAKWILNNVGSVFVHDITVQNGRLYAAAWDSGLWVYAVDQVATTMPVKLGSVGGNNTHSCWPTADGKFVVTAEERGGGGITVYEVTDTGTNVTMTFRDSVELTSTGQAFSVHNPIVVGNRVYCSWYQAGLQVFDIDPATGLLSFFGSFDTSPLANNGGFAGNWGVYPLLGPDRICLSDLSGGLFVTALQTDFSPPLPDPMQWAPGGEPAAISSSAMTMTAALATDAQNSVEYCIMGVSGPGVGSQCWQATRTFTDTGLVANTTYSYDVRARDTAIPPNETLPSSPALSGTTFIESPTTFFFGPVGATSIGLTGFNPSGAFTNLTVGSSGLFFEMTPPGGVNANVWVQSQFVNVTGLTPGTQYTVRVKARNQFGVETPFTFTQVISTTGGCTLVGDVNQDGLIDGADIDGYLRAKLGQPPSIGEEPLCADFGNGGDLALDTAAFVNALLLN